MRTTESMVQVGGAWFWTRKYIPWPSLTLSPTADGYQKLPWVGSLEIYDAVAPMGEKTVHVCMYTVITTKKHIAMKK